MNWLSKILQTLLPFGIKPSNPNMSCLSVIYVHIQMPRQYFIHKRLLVSMNHQYRHPDQYQYQYQHQYLHLGPVPMSIFKYNVHAKIGDKKLDNAIQNVCVSAVVRSWVSTTANAHQSCDIYSRQLATWVPGCRDIKMHQHTQCVLMLWEGIYIVCHPVTQRLSRNTDSQPQSFVSVAHI